MARRQPICAAALAAIAVSLVACASAPAPAQSPSITLAVTMLIPTATPAPPTDTPAPPTSTPAPAITSTPEVPSDNTLQAAILKTNAASYQIEMVMTGSGQPFAALSGDDQNTEVTLMAITGQHSRQNAAFTMSGLATALLGAGQDGAQVIAADGKTYLRGPAPLLGALEERWYILPDEQASMVQAPADMLQFLRRFAEDNTGEFEFAFDPEGSQEFEGQSCEVYIADVPATREALDSFGANIVPGAGSLSMQAGEFRIWICDDGFVHRLQMNFELSSADGERKVILFKGDVRLRDHGASIEISAPADAIALDLPGLMSPAP
ncbi:MAG: hypothetical protein ACUVRU_02965 [Anaerolineae bacterium]